MELFLANLTRKLANLETNCQLRHHNVTRMWPAWPRLSWGQLIVSLHVYTCLLNHRSAPMTRCRRSPVNHRPNINMSALALPDAPNNRLFISQSRAVPFTKHIQRDWILLWSFCVLRSSLECQFCAEVIGIILISFSITVPSIQGRCLHRRAWLLLWCMLTRGATLFSCALMRSEVRVGLCRKITWDGSL